MVRLCDKNTQIQLRPLFVFIYLVFSPLSLFVLLLPDGRMLTCPPNVAAVVEKEGVVGAEAHARIADRDALPVPSPPVFTATTLEPTLSQVAGWAPTEATAGPEGQAPPTTDAGGACIAVDRAWL